MNEKNSTLGEYIFAVSCSLAYEIRAAVSRFSILTICYPGYSDRSSINREKPLCRKFYPRGNSWPIRIRKRSLYYGR